MSQVESNGPQNLRDKAFDVKPTEAGNIKVSTENYQFHVDIVRDSELNFIGRLELTHKLLTELHPMEEYDYSKKSWIVENLDGSDDLLKDENWANTSLGHSDASTFPVFHDALALQLVKKGPSLATVYKAETKIMSLRYSTRTCRVGEETNERLARKCEKANVLCKTENGTIFEIADLEFDQRNEACLNENATFCEFTLCIFI